MDSDVMYHEEVSQPEVRRTFQEWWGPECFDKDGAVNRERLAEVFFDDPDQRKRMEEFVYPRLEKRRLAFMEQCRADPKVTAVVINSPLLYEFGLDADCDCVIFIECDEAIRQKRVAQTRGWPEEELRRREKLQKPLDFKRTKADYIVDNNSTIESLRPRVQALFQQIMSEACQDQGIRRRTP